MSENRNRMLLNTKALKTFCKTDARPLGRLARKLLPGGNVNTGLFLLILGLLAVAPLCAQAQLHPPEVRQVYPRGGSAGLTTRVTISGVSFRNANRIIFAQPGVTAKIVAPEMSKQPAPTMDNDN